MMISLSPMDYYFYRQSLYTIQFVFEYDKHLPLEKILSGLAAISKYCPATTSRLKIISDKKIALEGDHQIPLRVIHLESAIQDLESTDSFVDSITNAEGEPLVKLLVTYTPSQTFVGVSFSHLLGDGASFFQFLLILSNLINDRPITEICCNDRSLLHVGATPDLDLFESTGYIVPRPPSPISFKIEKIFYTFEELAALKQRHETSQVKFSSNDLLMALLAKCFYRDIPLHENQLIIRCPVEYRNIYGLPKNYFGNAVRDAVAIFNPDDMADLSTGEIAFRIKKSIQSVNRSSIQNSLSALEYLRLQKGINIFEDVGCPGLLVSNLSKFPVHRVDLGCGSPAKFHHASLSPRLALILPDEKGLKVIFKRPLSSAAK